MREKTFAQLMREAGVLPLTDEPSAETLRPLDLVDVSADLTVSVHWSGASVGLADMRRQSLANVDRNVRGRRRKRGVERSEVLKAFAGGKGR